MQEIAERVLHLKQLSDNLYIFPLGEESLKDKWYNANILKLSLLLGSISKILENDGFTVLQSLSMQRSWGKNNIHDCIKDSVDKKGAGLYDFMVEALADCKFKINS